MAETYTRKGVKLCHLESAGGRFGPGKVHVAMRYPATEHHAAHWRLVCMKNDKWYGAVGFGSHPMYCWDTSKDEAPTCKKCIKALEKVGIL